MRLVRFAVAGVLAVVVLGSGASAMAGVIAPGAGTTSVSFTTPSADGQTFTGGPVTLSGTVERPGGNVDQIQIVVKWTDTVAGRPKSGHPDLGTTIVPTSPGSSEAWSYTLPNVANGGYSVVITATTDDGAGHPDSVSVGRAYSMDLLPAAPAGLVDTVHKSDRTVTLNWTANQEPDLIGYQVFRGGPTSKDPYGLVNGVLAPATTFTDTTVSTKPAGTYRYVVVAVRSSAAGGTRVNSSGPSTESDAQFTTPPPTPPTTSVAPAPTAAPTNGSAASRAGGIISGTPVLPGGNGLSDYQALVNQAQATTATSQPPDPGFTDKLPYRPQTSQQAVTLPNDGPLGTGGGGTGNRRTAEYVAGALLLAVVAMFALLLKRAADQAPVLEAIAHDDAQIDDAAVDDVAVEAPVVARASRPVALVAASRRRRRAAEPAPLPPVAGAPARNVKPTLIPDVPASLTSLFTPVAAAPKPEPVPLFDYEADRLFDGDGSELELVGSGPVERPLRSVWRD